MLLPVCVGLLALLAGAVLVARLSLRVMHALGLELVPTLLWLGIAEEPHDRPLDRRSERRRLAELYGEPTAVA